MSFVLTASVGIRGVNRSWDVLFVQDALNNVPPGEGGPSVALVLDGLCGPKTKGAIQKFQLHHFGWAGADGLVEVERQTHQKLKEYWKKPPELPPRPTPKEPKSTRFVVQTTHKKESFGGNRRDWFFEIRSVPHNAATRYFLDGHPSKVPTPVPSRFDGHVSIFNTVRSLTTREFECDAVYMTRERAGGARESQLMLLLPSGAVTIPMKSHLIGPGGLMGRGTGRSAGATASMPGRFMRLALT